MPPRPSHWETTTFYRPADVAIIGAGLIGLQTALRLKATHPQADVLVIDRAPIPRGAATRNAGFACFGGPTELLADLDAHGYAATLATVRSRYTGIRRLEEHFADQGIGWHRHGGYELLDDPETEATVRARLPEINGLLEEATGKKTVWNFTDQTPRPLNATLLYNPLEAQLHPGKLVEHLLQTGHRAGIRFLFGSPVLDLQEDASSSDHPVRIVGDGWPGVSARRVLLATNAFSAGFLPDDFPETVRPVRNQVLFSRPLPGLRLRGCYHYHEGYVYFRNVGPDRLLIGGARHRAGERSETEAFGPNPVPEAYLLEKLRAWYPGRPWTADDFPTRWSGIIAHGNGKNPILRFTNTSKTVLVVARLAGMGVALSAELAERAAATLT